MKVRIKSGDCPSYLTGGKSYGAILWFRNKFYIKELDIQISMNNCKHLKGGSWEIVDE